ncbi:uncharacterized protein AB675_11634 [Cyphellophora attinorum]|uniref:BZIP domain-containing protein n=1 Tax=Cyphellophora attinorum TaxID=1664694 RepID=A0A0N0NHT3_9EURO|nr:uncharacterized protein AB675_11634 [Phialophora attinorum]KPI34639.1 hypothetical protein AB675_11634 [Phialophora attinorum]
MGPPKRKAPALDVPRKDEDPAERKRILNVLAQRRYRQKRKEHLNKLEAATLSSTANSEAERDLVDSQRNHPDVNQRQFNSLPPEQAKTPCLQDFQEAFPPDIFDEQVPIGNGYNAFDHAIAFPDDLQLTDSLWPLPSLPSSPRSSHTSSLTSFSSPTSSNASPPNAISFPDEHNLGIPSLDLMRGAHSIALRLGLLPMMWDLEGPTALQRRVPHHPLVDLLPWPTVRDKMLLVFSTPVEIRPPAAAKPTALVDFVYDLEDAAEGSRIHGDDPFSDQNWEVGEKLFRDWWWAFDSQVIARSNALRRERGAPLLGRGTGIVLGEVT